MLLGRLLRTQRWGIFDLTIKNMEQDSWYPAACMVIRVVLAMVAAHVHSWGYEDTYLLCRNMDADEYTRVVQWPSLFTQFLFSLSGESPRIDNIRVVGAVKYEKIIPIYSPVMDPRNQGVWGSSSTFQDSHASKCVQQQIIGLDDHHHLKEADPEPCGTLTARANVGGCCCCSSRLHASGPCAKCKTRSSSLNPLLSLSLSLVECVLSMSPCVRRYHARRHHGYKFASTEGRVTKFGQQASHQASSQQACLLHQQTWILTA